MSGQFAFEALTFKNYRKNRTIVSSDCESILQDIDQELPVPLQLHRYPTGYDVATWSVPPAWNVKEAWVKGPDGRVVASYDEHPLFLAPYSTPFSGVVSKQELMKHVRFHPKREEDFYYEHRYAYDFRNRLSDWVITMPRQRFDALPEGAYEVHLDIEISDGEMLVGEWVLPGNSTRCVVLLADYCHPGQVNDSWTGILAMIQVMRRLADLPDRRYTYRLLVLPETIGSCIHLAANDALLEQTDLAIFSEFVGWGRNWKILAGERNDRLAMDLAEIGTHIDSEFTAAGLYEGYGNDEIIFDYAGVPALSVQMAECDEYHSSSDHPDLIEQGNIDKAADMIFHLTGIMEKNRNYRFAHKVPVYLTRYELYSDAVLERSKFRQNREIINGINDGLKPVEIWRKTGIPFEEICEFIERLEQKNLIA
ncbi:MAG: DUF4910 domain-containing protein [Rhizobiaceae bacterium]